MKTVALPDGTLVPALGLGTWHMGESAGQRAIEVDAVRAAIGMGYRLIDTAEMYGEGGAEKIVGEAVAGALRDGEVRRDELVVVSKVYPHNASRAGVPAACERSLRRLGLDRIDLYLLHWRGSVPLAETVEALRALVASGRIGGYMELEGSAEQISAMKDDEEFLRNFVNASLCVDDLRMTDGYCNQGVADQMAIYTEAVAKVPQTA